MPMNSPAMAAIFGGVTGNVSADGGVSTGAAPLYRGLVLKLYDVGKFPELAIPMDPY